MLFTTAHHPVTTSGHCSAVARAIPPNVPVFRVPHLRNSWGDLPNHTDNVESYVRRISELLAKAKRARTNRDWQQREALGLREQLQRYQLHDMAARVYRAVWLDTIDDVVSEMEGVTIADILPSRFAYPANEVEPAPGMRYREACAQRGLHFVAYDAKHGRHARNVTGVRVTSVKPLDLFCLFFTPFFLSDPRCLFPALPFFFLVRRNPRLQCVEFTALRESDIAQVEERHIVALAEASLIWPHSTLSVGYREPVREPRVTCLEVALKELPKRWFSDVIKE